LSYLNTIDNLDREIKLLEGRICEALIRKSNELKIITPVPGIGFIGASILIAEIGNIHDFKDADKLAKWAVSASFREGDTQRNNENKRVETFAIERWAFTSRNHNIN
jgi:transposase